MSYDPISNTSVVRCTPITGRTHQIRVHLQFLGHPIGNDPLYSKRTAREFVLIDLSIPDNPSAWGPANGKGGLFPQARFEHPPERPPSGQTLIQSPSEHHSSEQTPEKSASETLSLEQLSLEKPSFKKEDLTKDISSQKASQLAETSIEDSNAQVDVFEPSFTPEVDVIRPIRYEDQLNFLSKEIQFNRTMKSIKAERFQKKQERQKIEKPRRKEDEELMNLNHATMLAISTLRKERDHEENYARERDMDGVRKLLDWKMKVRKVLQDDMRAELQEGNSPEQLVISDDLGDFCAGTNNPLEIQ
jgi:hypothetical protein